MIAIGKCDTTYIARSLWYCQYQLQEIAMRLLASTDYALRILMLLAEQPNGERLSVETLARRLGGLSRHHLH